MKAEKTQTEIPSRTIQFQSRATYMTDNRLKAVQQRVFLNKLIIQKVPLPGTSHSTGVKVENLEATSLRMAAYNMAERIRVLVCDEGQTKGRLGENFANNLYLKCLVNTEENTYLEAWVELTLQGGGYVKRIKVTRQGAIQMDRVMDGNSTFNEDLKTDRGKPSAKYQAMHQSDPADTQPFLSVEGDSAKSADNYTKLIGEGARFGWLAKKLANGEIGDTTKNIFKVKVKYPQFGMFSADPTFHQLWNCFDSVFNKHYMQRKVDAINILRERIIEGWRRTNKGEEVNLGAAPLEHGKTATGEVTSVKKINGQIVALLPNAEPNGAQIVSRLGMKWESDN